MSISWSPSLANSIALPRIHSINRIVPTARAPCRATCNKMQSGQIGKIRFKRADPPHVPKTRPLRDASHLERLASFAIAAVKSRLAAISSPSSEGRQQSLTTAARAWYRVYLIEISESSTEARRLQLTDTAVCAHRYSDSEEPQSRFQNRTNTCKNNPKEMDPPT